jgi:hypothetical protein
LLTLIGERHLDDAALAAEGHQQTARRLADQDLATSVTFELEISAFT